MRETDITMETPHDPFNLPPADLVDPVIEAYRKDIDVGLLRENLKRTVEERIMRMQDAVNAIDELRRARKVAG
jgi:hypothetical protein